MKKTILFLCFTLIQVAITCLPGFTWAGVVYPQRAPKDLNKYLDIALEGGEEKLKMVNMNMTIVMTVEHVKSLIMGNGKFKCI